MTSMLTARADGKEYPVYILIPQKSPDKTLIKKYWGRAVIKYEDTNWMNGKLTRSFLDDIIKKDIFGNQQLSIWDAYNPHHTDETRRYSEKMNLVMRLIPSGMTGVLSPPDVSWNGPLKNYVRVLRWMVDCCRFSHVSWMDCRYMEQNIHRDDNQIFQSCPQ